MAIEKNYQTLKLVAKGGTAVLYKAVQTSLDRVVAVKKLHQHLTEDENFTRRFVLEAKAAASLDHDNIVKIIDFGVEDTSYHMIMEYIEGESLREIIDKWQKIPVDIALAVVYQVLQGLEHAHAKGIVHRDIKPGNIMVTRTGRVKITDFGLAKLTQTTTQHTAANSILGTPLYMSPEQAYGESVDHRSDLFSLGTMLYEMLTGAQPFRDENYMGVIQNIINRNAPHPSKFSVEIPSAVQSLLSKAMNKSREARFQHASDFRNAVEQYMGLAQLKEANERLRHLLVTDGATVVLPNTMIPREKRSRLRRGFMVALVTATLFGAAGYGYFLAPDRIHQQLREWASSFDRDPARPSTEADNIMAASGDLAVPYVTDVPGDSAKAPPPVGPNDAATPDTLREEATIASAAANPAGADSSAPPLVPEASTPPDSSAPGIQASTPPPAEPVVQKGWISVNATPWAEIYVDGQYRGDSPPPLRIELPRGPHALECRNPKYLLYRETVNITAGELSTRNVILKQLTGRLSVKATQGSEVYVDGKLIGVAPLDGPIELEVGAHQVTVKKAGFNVWNNQITLGADEDMSLNITLSPIY